MQQQQPPAGGSKDVPLDFFWARHALLCTDCSKVKSFDLHPYLEFQADPKVAIAVEGKQQVSEAGQQSVASHFNAALAYKSGAQQLPS